MSPDVHPLVDQLARRLIERGETLSCAESCTGGLLSSLITAFPGISSVFAGAVVAYAYEVKEEWLGVSHEMLNTLGAVSLPVARQMAKGVREGMKTTWSLSITGIAGPGGGTPQKPVGTVCFGISGPRVVSDVGDADVVETRAEQRHFSGSRKEIQMLSAEHALRMLLSELAPD